MQWCNHDKHWTPFCTAHLLGGASWLPFHPKLLHVLSLCSVLSLIPLTFDLHMSTSADLRQQHLTSFCAVCGVLFDCNRESTVVFLGLRAVMPLTNICSQSAECLYATFVTKPPWGWLLVLGVFKLSCSTPFTLFLHLVSIYWPFQLYFIPKTLSTIPPFSAPFLQLTST